ARVADDERAWREVWRAGESDVSGGAAAAHVIQVDGVRRPRRAAPDAGKIPAVDDGTHCFHRAFAGRDLWQLPDEVRTHDVGLRVAGAEQRVGNRRARASRARSIGMVLRA